MITIRAAACGLATTLVVACGPALPPHVADSAHVSLYAFAPPDTGLMDWLDHAVVTYGTFFGVADPHVDIYVLASESDVDDHCGIPRGLGLRTGGCAIGRTTYVSIPYYSHELVHAVGFNVSDPPGWVREGLAEAIGGGYHGSAVAPDAALAGWLDESGWTSGGWSVTQPHYAVAASFVRYVIGHGGHDAFIRYYGALNPGSSAADQRAAFAATFGASLDDWIIAWVASGPRDWSEIVDPLPACATDPLGPGLNTITVQSGPRPFPEFDPEYHHHAFRTLTLDAPTRLRLTQPAPSPTSSQFDLWVYGCASHTNFVNTFPLPGAAYDGVFDLGPGHYVFQVNVQNGPFGTTPLDPGPVTVDLLAAMSGAPTCDPPVVTVTPGTLVDLHPAVAASWTTCSGCVAWYRLHTDSAVRVALPTVLVDGVEVPRIAQVLLCDAACAPLASCAALAATSGPDATFDIAPGVDRYLVLTPAADANWFRQALRVDAM